MNLIIYEYYKPYPLTLNMVLALSQAEKLFINNPKLLSSNCNICPTCNQCYDSNFKGMGVVVLATKDNLDVLRLVLEKVHYSITLLIIHQN